MHPSSKSKDPSLPYTHTLLIVVLLPFEQVTCHFLITSCFGIVSKTNTEDATTLLFHSFLIPPTTQHNTMETVGSTRLGRASSRYGAPTVFNGPVRKWEKKWVHVSPSSFNKNNSKNKNDNGSDKSSLLLRRWTPVTNTSSADDVSDEPPRRKFRYTPVCFF
jgi:hypothetical protein